MVINSRHILLPKNKKLKKWYWWYKIKKNSIFVISIFKLMHEQFSQADYDVRSISHATMALSGCDIITCQSVLCHRVSQSDETYLSISLCLTKCTCVLWSIVPWCVNIFCPHFPCTHTSCSRCRLEQVFLMIEHKAKPSARSSKNVF